MKVVSLTHLGRGARHGRRGAVAAAVLLSVAAGGHADVSDAQARRAVAVFIYQKAAKGTVSSEGGSPSSAAARDATRQAGETLRPTGVQSGVRLDSRSLITASGPLRDAGQGETQDVYAVLGGAETSVVRCNVERTVADGRVAVLRVERDSAGSSAGVDGPPSTGRLAPGRRHRVVGAVGAFGLQPEELGGPATPRWVGFAVEIGEKREADAPLRGTLPRTLAGAGVWKGDTLVGVALREDGLWRVLDIETVVSSLDLGREERTVQKGGPPGRTGNAPAPLKEPLFPGPFREPLAQVSKEPEQPITDPTLLMRLRELGLEPQLDARLVRRFADAAANRAMAWVAGGRPERALKVIEKRAEEGAASPALRYVEGLARVLTGDYEQARSRLYVTQIADSRKVRAAGRLLLRVLDVCSDGKYLGVPLAAPNNLVDAIEEKVVRSMRNRLRQLLTRLKSREIDGRKSFERTRRDLRSLAKRATFASAAWPTGFDALAEKISDYRERVIEKEDQRIREKLARLHDRIAMEKGMLSREGEKAAGFTPAVRAGRVNALIERYNKLLREHKALKKKLDESRSLPEGLPTEPMATLPVAGTRPDGRMPE